MGDAGYIIPALNDAGAGYQAFWKKKNIDVQPFLESAAGSTVNLPIAEGWTAKSPEINKTVNDLYLNKVGVADIAAAMDKIGNDK
jgi:multiple sugar transport system substrate-binding protein